MKSLKRKLSETDQALEASDTRYRALFENAGDAIFIHDLEGTIIDVNQKAMDILGYTKEEISSIKIPMLHPPESLERSKKAFETIMKEGQVTFEIDFIAKNGLEATEEEVLELQDYHNKVLKNASGNEDNEYCLDSKNNPITSTA